MKTSEAFAENNGIRILAINLGTFGSTGSIVKSIGSLADREGFEYAIAVPYEPEKPDESYYMIGNLLSRKINPVMAIVTGMDGCFAKLQTQKFIQRIDRFQPDIIHLHNIHYSFLNYAMLFKHIKKKKISVVWTLHDCWSFTGHCPHFMYEQCEKWKTGCTACPKYHSYPKSIFDNSRFMWKKKKEWFTGIPQATIVSPSQWLADRVGESFLKEYPRKIIPNGIDLSVFRPVSSDFRQKHDLQNKKLVLGVAYGWDDKKGLDVFIELSQKLPEGYQVVLVGTDPEVDKLLPKSILAIPRTQNRQELAQIYSAADVFVNPTREDTFPTVNLEANACGTPVVTFRTGGSPECIDENSGSVVKYNDTDALEAEIIRICTQRPYSRQACIENAARFEKGACFSRYIQLYKELVDAKKM